MTHVQLKNIEKAFGGHPVLQQLDLEIESGDYLVLLGPSGCGKTTTLRVMAGLQRPDQGDVLMDHRLVTRVAPRHRDVSMVFQHDGLYPHLTVGQSLQAAIQSSVGAKERSSRVDQAIELTGISALVNRYPRELSGGELRRASVAKAIARRASVRLLDEPLSALDIPVRHALQDDILNWHTEFNGTTVHVTHDGREAMRMADKIAVMDQGRIAQLGTPREIYFQPRSVAVAQSIGAPPINLLAARLSEGTLSFQNANVNCPPRAFEDCGPREVLVGIRPEAIRPFDSVRESEGVSEDSSILSGDVLIAGELVRNNVVGRERYLTVTSSDDSITATVIDDQIQTSAIKAGAMRLTVQLSDLHLFDANTGERVGNSSGR